MGEQGRIGRRSGSDWSAVPPPLNLFFPTDQQLLTTRSRIIRAGVQYHNPHIYISPRKTVQNMLLVKILSGKCMMTIVISFCQVGTLNAKNEIESLPRFMGVQYTLHALNWKMGMENVTSRLLNLLVTCSKLFVIILLVFSKYPLSVPYSGSYDE